MSVIDQRLKVGRQFLAKNGAKFGECPAIVLQNPKHARNVAMIIRLASCYGIKQVWYSGNRIESELVGKKNKPRLPREERMKGYDEVDLLNFDWPLEQFVNVIPIAFEVRQTSEQLHLFDHPLNAVYVFGPEDGSIDPGTLRHCHRFVEIPTRHCLNLGTAVATVLWDRQVKLCAQGLVSMSRVGESESRGAFDLDVEAEDVLTM